MVFMTARSVKAPPARSASRGEAFLACLTDDYELTAVERELALEAARTLDLVDALQQQVDSDGLVTAGSMGQQRANPLLGELRQARLVLARLLSGLALPEEERPAAVSDAAAAAARARWGRRGTA